MNADPFWENVTEHAGRSGGALAVADPMARLTWRELADAVRRRAGELPGPAAGPPRVTGLHRANDVSWVVDFLALRRLGHVVVALPSSLPATAADRYASSFGACGVLHDGGRRPLAPAVADAPRFRDEALIHLTSGTTGSAAGIPRGRVNLTDEADAVVTALGLHAGEPLLLGTPVAHSFASGLLLAALRCGAPSVLLPGFDVAAMVALADRYRPGIISGTPYVFRMLAGTARARRAGPAGLRVPLCGGAHLHDSWARHWLDTVGVPLCQEYGLSEGGIATVNAEHAARRPGSVGRPLPNVGIAVVDDMDLPLSPGVPGRVVIDRPDNAVAYLDGRGRRRPVPVVRPGSPVAGIHTGDLGRLDQDGLLYITGRTKAMINVGGAKVSPEELERHLLAHPAVRDAVVVGVSDEVRGEAVGALVETAGPTPTIAELAEHLRERVSEYALPRRWRLGPRIPRTGSGKPDRHLARTVLEE